MSKLSLQFARLISDRSGATALEYGLIVGLISLAVVAGAGTAGTAINSMFTGIGTTLSNALAAVGA